MIDLDFLRGLIDAVDDSGVDSLEINRSGTQIRISKTPLPQASSVPAQSAPAATPAAAPAQQAADTAAPAPTGAGAPESAETPSEPPAEPASELEEVTSPMVGTFYRAPSPEAPPYVEVGNHVSEGQTLCILEAMKLMNELESEIDGVVREILVKNEEPVEYGQALFRIEPNSGG